MASILSLIKKQSHLIMMLQQFNTLSKENQQDILLKQGTFLAEREDGPFKVMLYQYEGFYV